MTNHGTNRLRTGLHALVTGLRQITHSAKAAEDLLARFNAVGMPPPDLAWARRYHHPWPRFLRWLYHRTVRHAVLWYLRQGPPARPLPCGHDRDGSPFQPWCIYCASELSRREGHAECGAYVTRQELFKSLKRRFQ